MWPWRVQPPGTSEEPDNQIVLPHRSASHSVVVNRNRGHVHLKCRSRQVPVQASLEEGENRSDATSLRAPIHENVPLQVIQPPRRGGSGLCNGIHHGW